MRQLLIALTLASVTAACAKTEKTPEPYRPPDVGDAAPTFTVATLAGDSARVGGSAPQPVTLVNICGNTSRLDQGFLMCQYLVVETGLPPLQGLTIFLKGIDRKTVKRFHAPDDLPECHAPCYWEADDHSRFSLNLQYQFPG